MVSTSGVSYVPLLEPVEVDLGGVAAYALNDLDNSEPLYVGKVTASGTWLVQRFTGGAVMAYANLSNNPATTTYADAWTNRATLTYGAFQTLTGV